MPIQAAAAAGSVDACAALLLHGASPWDAEPASAESPAVRLLLELWRGRAPHAGEGAERIRMEGALCPSPQRESSVDDLFLGRCLGSVEYGFLVD